MSRCKLWKTKDGTTIRIMDMGDEHLINVALFLENKHKELLEFTDPPTFQGEMAQYYAEGEYFALMQSDVGDIYDIYNDVAEEIEHRSLNKDLDAKREERRCRR